MHSAVLSANHLLSKELDFMIHGILEYELFGQKVWLTTTTVSLWVVSVLLIVFALFARRAMKNASDIPGGFQNILEFLGETIENMAQGILGKHAYKFVNYVGTIFLFILFSNLGGLLGLRNPTADYGVTFALGIMTFIIVQYQGFKNRKIRHITSLFEPTPILFPLNLIGEIANPISISLRLYANILSGFIMLGLWYGMMPIITSIGIPAALHVYCDIFSGCIQTYVFCMLTMVYINDKME
ncbi:MAG: F0F1 ATP synthase subunit A [Johnsonella sp.]|nr:F0F1 ATP synthase subunit A [Johnsonella sp.]